MHGRSSMSVTALDTLLALKAICLAPGLNSNQRQVGAVLIEHFNRKTGQCDPGHGRIAKLLGVDTRTAIRATTGLVAYGLFKKVRHGGRSSRNLYIPEWSRFDQICADWDDRMKGSRSALMTEKSLRERQTCHVSGGNAATQTCQSILQSTCGGLPGNKKGAVGLSPSSRLELRGQSPLDAARTAAERRWTSALTSRFAALPVTHAEIIEAITPALSAAATEAEMKRPGSGLEYLIRELRVSAPNQ
jgi:hypothetical protein